MLNDLKHLRTPLATVAPSTTSIHQHANVQKFRRDPFAPFLANALTFSGGARCRGPAGGHGAPPFQSPFAGTATNVLERAVFGWAAPGGFGWPWLAAAGATAAPRYIIQRAVVYSSGGAGRPPLESRRGRRRQGRCYALPLLYAAEHGAVPGRRRSHCSARRASRKLPACQTMVGWRGGRGFVGAASTQRDDAGCRGLNGRHAAPARCVRGGRLVHHRTPARQGRLV
jgi:hypothetical protein